MSEVQETMPPRTRLKARDRTKCMRCEGRAQYLVRDTTLCRPCFIKNIQVRLARTFHAPLLPNARANVTVRPPLQAGDALIALSGGAGSTALFDHLTSRTYVGVEGVVYDITRGGREPVWNRAWAVHVVFPGNDEEETEKARMREELRRLVESRGIRYVEVGAEEVWDAGLGERLRRTYVSHSEKEVADDLPSSQAKENKARLAALITSLPPPSRPTILQHIFDALLATVAANLPNISHMLLGETSTREAQRVITGTAQGRGWSLPLDLATTRALPPLLTKESGSGERVVRLRAAREVSVKEAALYCHALGLGSFNYRRWESGRGRKDASSIEGLTERFVATLSTRHPATVGAITRTASKLQFTGDEAGPLCTLCRKPADPSPEEWKARASLTALPGRLPAPSSSTAAEDELDRLLCYACLTTLNGRKEGSLPPFVDAGAHERREGATEISRGEMREAIADFLLDEAGGEEA